MKDRVILHCDCNSFFASVEIAKNPKLKGLPVAVCGSVEERHGIVLAKSEEAKKLGVTTAETVYSAKKKCPNLVIVPPHYSDYISYSERVNSIYAKYTDMIESFGIDESWLDVTASSLFGSGEEIAEKIRKEVKEKVGITVSIGVSFNKVFAKLGSDYKKPDAVTVIDKCNFKSIVYPLPVGELLFIGKRTEEQLRLLGVKTIGELAEVNPDLLLNKFGKLGKVLSDYARGLDRSPVESSNPDESKSIGNGYTFRRDLVGRDACRNGIEFLCEEIGSKLRKRGLICSTVQLSIKNPLFKTIQRQKSQNPPTDLASEIAKTAFSIYCNEWNEENPVRTITVTVGNLTVKNKTPAQLDFFGETKSDTYEKDVKRENTVDEIRGKFGLASIIRANVMDENIGVYPKKHKKE